jgi:flagellar hook-length control protein FliK
MLEAGLQQLKSDLQNQGLHVDRLEVAVSDDLNKQFQRRTQSQGSRKAGGIEGVASDGRSMEEERSETIYYRPWSAGPATIDMFA